MKKTIQIIVVTLVVIAAVAGFFHVRNLWEEKEDQQQLLEQRIVEIQRQKEMENQELKDRIDELMTEEEVVFDAAPIKEQILNIGELATVSYCYTDVGTVDSTKNFSFVSCKIPFSAKHLVISMDGVLKAGVDMNKVEIITDEAAKRITVKIPEAKVLSNELMEDTMETHVEEDQMFSEITSEDCRNARMVIRKKALEKAMEYGLLDQAHDQAGLMIRSLIEAVPGVKGTYTIVIA